MASSLGEACVVDLNLPEMGDGIVNDCRLRDAPGCTDITPQPGGKATYFPTKFSSTELFPALWPPTTAICGRSRFAFCPMEEKASCMRFTRGIKSSIPRFPIFAVQTQGLPHLSPRTSFCTLAFKWCFFFNSARTHRFTSRFSPSFTAPPQCVRSATDSLHHTPLQAPQGGGGGGGGWSLVFYKEIPAIPKTHR